MNTKRTQLRKRLWPGALAAILFVCAGMMLTACDDFLTEDPKGSLAGPVLENRDGVNKLLIGAYHGLNPTSGGDASAPGGSIWMASADNWVYGSVMGGDAKKGTDAGDQNPMNPLMRGAPDPTNVYLNTHWRSKFEAIARANEVLKILAKVPEGQFTAAEIADIQAQARFLRGHAYFELRRMYKMVPWMDETTVGYDQPNDQEIYPKIEADLKFAYENLPETQKERARVNKWAAGAYLAKVYLQQQKWQEARDLFTTVINQGQTSDGKKYDLVPKFHDLFLPSAQYNAENVFMVEFTGEDGKTSSIYHSRNGSMLNYPYNSPFRCCGFYQPSQDLVNSYRTQDGLPFLDSYNSVKVTSDQGVGSDQDFTPYAGKLDPRLDWTVGRRGLPYLDWGPHPGQRWVRDQAYAGPYAPKKHVYMKANPQDVNNGSWAPGSAVNYHIIRFADVLLMAAEAEAQLGNTGKALEYVNRVRRRAANQDGFVTNNDNKAFAKAVVDNEAAMLASGAIIGEWVVRTDLDATFVLVRGGENPAATLTNWVKYDNPKPNYEVAEYTAADFGSKEEALKRIYFERKLELAMEGHRLFDLFRWGNAAQVMNAYFAYDGAITNDVAGAVWSFPADYFPIPQIQIDNSLGQLKQNQGY